jgi:Tol biopolymer transport system component
MLFGVTLLFSFILLAVNAWGAPYISFNSKRTGQSDIIYIIDTNGKNLRNLTNHPADDTGATWAPDGRSFAFVLDLDGNNEIYIKTFNVAQARRLTNHPELDFSPSWSPDGNWIAFVAGRTGGLHIYKIDINGKNLQRLTNQGKYNLDPDWSPDGQSIAFYSTRNLELWDGTLVNVLDLYVMDADGKNLRQMINPRRIGLHSPRSPAWSPDGKQIAYTAEDDGIGIYIMDTDGQNARRVSPLGTWSYNPAWSLDGKWIAYDAYDEPIANPPDNLVAENANPPDNSNAVRHIFIVSVEGGEPRQITQHPGPNYSPAWVPESFFSVSPTVDTQTTLWGRLKQAERMTQ